MTRSTTPSPEDQSRSQSQTGGEPGLYPSNPPQMHEDWDGELAAIRVLRQRNKKKREAENRDRARTAQGRRTRAGERVQLCAQLCDLGKRLRHEDCIYQFSQGLRARIVALQPVMGIGATRPPCPLLRTTRRSQRFSVFKRRLKWRLWQLTGTPDG